MDKSTRRSVFVLYIILFLLSITSVSMIQISMNRFTAYTLNIEYERHRCTMDSLPWDHDYTAIVVNIQIMVDNYETECNFRIGNFPFWVDTSDWSDGELVTISASTYTLSEGSTYWVAYREIDNEMHDSLYYHKQTGIFYESHSDRSYFDSYHIRGYTEDIEIQSDNIDGFVARLTGSNVAGNIILLSAIFTEILIVQWLYTRRQKSKTIKSSK